MFGAKDGLVLGLRPKLITKAERLKVNIAKSRLLGVGVPNIEVELIALSLGCTHDSLPFTYLGLPVGKKMHLKRLYEAIRCRFFWDFKDSQRGISWVKWNTILLDRDKGGLGVGSLLAKNQGLLGKWKWRFLIEKKSLWREVINEFYGNDEGFGSLPISYHVKGIWHDIIKATSSIGWELLMVCTPRGRAIDELSSLISLIGNLSLDSNGIDKWMWTGDVSGKFKIPRKVNICVWRSSLNRLPTCGNLVRRGVNISSNLYPLCVNTIEEIEHSIINCPRAIAVWRKVWSWWCLSPPLSFPSFTIDDIALNMIRTPGCAHLNKVLHGVVSVTIWVIWKWRNKIFTPPNEAWTETHVRGRDVIIYITQDTKNDL
ncbi:RNA-directed DNA polymerase, eukaryota, reverse transcriptase zinc-binding domain protein [Tanacetum coccineum]